MNRKSDMVSDISNYMEQNNKSKSKNRTMIQKSDMEFDIKNCVTEENNSYEGVIIEGDKIIKKTKDNKTPALKRLEVDVKNARTEYPSSYPRTGTSGSTKKTHNGMETPDGIIRYTLSDRSFIEKGWTKLPVQKVLRKMNVYRMRPAYPEFDWFEHNKGKGFLTYETGEKLAEIDQNGRGRWYYKNGKVALDYYDSEDVKSQQRLVIYGSGEPDEKGRSHTISVLCMFDYMGNGVVFDHNGKIRLKYNQSEGVVLDRAIGPVSTWQWHSLNDPPILEHVIIDTNLLHKDPEIQKLESSFQAKKRAHRIYDKEMVDIEYERVLKEKSKKMALAFKPFDIKMKALKINEQFSLRIQNQTKIYLLFRDGTTHLKLNIGMILDHHEIVDMETTEAGEVTTNFESLPAQSRSMEHLQKKLDKVRRMEYMRRQHELRLRPTVPVASIDRMTAAVSRRPCRPPPPANMTDNSNITNQNPYQRRKPTCTNYYCNTNFV